MMDGDHLKIYIPIIVLFTAIFSVSFSEQCKSPGEKIYSNPILDKNFADPTVIKASNGLYYVYATNTITSEGQVNIQVARSENLVDWECIGDALPEKPSWANLTQTFWAPHVIYDSSSEQYFMYYSAGLNDTDNKCLAVAISSSPEGPFRDKGSPLLCGEGFINIDPMAFDDPITGKKLLYWGSGFEPIKVRELADDRINFRPDSETIQVLFPGKDKDYNILVEGAWIIYRNGYYYLFYSGDNCCGEKANYAVMVARADNPFGPFERFGEANGTGSSVILHKNNDWNAPGHNSVITDDAGNDWMYYHAIDPDQPHIEGVPHGTRRVMLMDEIIFVDGWPRIENNIPSSSRVRAPIILK